MASLETYNARVDARTDIRESRTDGRQGYIPVQLLLARLSPSLQRNMRPPVLPDPALHSLALSEPIERKATINATSAYIPISSVPEHPTNPRYCRLHHRDRHRHSRRCLVRSSIDNL